MCSSLSSPAAGLARIVAALVLVLGCGREQLVDGRRAHAQAQPTPDRLAETREAIDTLAAESMRANAITGVSLALVDGNAIAWATGWGMADEARGIAAGPETVYAVGSLTKPITAAAVLQAVERGELELDRSLAELLPDLELGKDAGAHITLEDLLRHQSGLPSDWYVHDLSASPPPWAGVVDELRGRAPDRPPREVSAYSNLGISLAGVALGRIDGRSYEQRVRELLLQPAGMRSAYFHGQAPSSAPHAAAYEGGELRRDPVFRLAPAGGLHASVLDLAAFARMVLAEGRVGATQVLAPASVEAMLRAADDPPALDLDQHYGYAWALGHPELDWAGRVALHRGMTAYHSSIMILLPDHGLAVAAAANSLGAAPVLEALAVETLLLALQETRGLEAPSPPPNAELREVPPELLGRFLAAHAGDYVTSMGLATIEAVDGQVQSREVTGIQPIVLDNEHGGLLPRLPGQRIRFAEIDGHHLMILERGEPPRRRRAAVRLSPPVEIPAEIPEAWRARAGAWRIHARPGEFASVDEIELRVVDGRLRLEFFGRLQRPPMHVVLVLEPLDDRRARIAGLARGQGTIIEASVVDGQPRLWWSGGELVPRGSDD